MLTRTTFYMKAEINNPAFPFQGLNHDPATQSHSLAGLTIYSIKTKVSKSRAEAWELMNTKTHLGCGVRDSLDDDKKFWNYNVSCIYESRTMSWCGHAMNSLHQKDSCLPYTHGSLRALNEVKFTYQWNGILCCTDADAITKIILCSSTSSSAL